MLIHAAGESSPGKLPPGTFAIALAVADEPALAALLARLTARGVPVHAVHEPDMPYCGQLMAIGVRPAPRSQLRWHLSDVPLLKFTPESSNGGRPARGTPGSNPASGTNLRGV